MNIVQVSGGELKMPVEKGGGVEAYIFSISKQLSKMGHSVTILDRKYSPADPDVENVKGVKIVRLRIRRFDKLNFTLSFVLNQICFASQVRKYLTNADFDAINLHVSINGLILSATSPRLRSKLFYTSHSARRLKKPLTLLDCMALILENLLVKHVRKVIVLNDPIRKKLITEAIVKPEKVVLIPIGIDTNNFSPNSDVDSVRRRYEFEGKVTILFVGRIRAHKGVEYLVKAANMVVNKFGVKKAQFLLVGPIEEFGSGEGAHSSYLAKIMRRIEDYGLRQNVTLTGLVPFDDLRRLYAACDIFVLPSLTEAMPTAPLEAMASGRPVIGTRVGGVPAEVKDGQTGFLIDAADERQLAERIMYFIDNPEDARMMGACGRKLAEEEFSVVKLTERLLQVYQSVLPHASREGGFY